MNTIKRGIKEKATPATGDVFYFSDSENINFIRYIEWSDLVALLAGAGSTPSGSNTEVQFNDGGAFGAEAAFTYDKTTNKLTVDLIHTSTVQAHTSAGVVIEATGGADCALFGAGGGQNVTFYDGVKLDAKTASAVVITDSSKNLDTLVLGAGQSIRRNSGDTAYEAYTPSGGSGLTQQQVEGLI